VAELASATSYSDLLEPIPNAVALLKPIDAARTQQGPVRVQLPSITITTTIIITTAITRVLAVLGGIIWRCHWRAAAALLRATSRRLLLDCGATLLERLRLGPAAACEVCELGKLMRGRGLCFFTIF